MALSNKFDQTYTVTTALPKAVIVNTFKERIEAAAKDTSWFTTADINYKKIKVDEFRAVIRFNPVFGGQAGGIGVAMLRFETINGHTKIEAVVKPFITGVGIILGIITCCSALVIWITPGAAKYLFIGLGWCMVLASIGVSIAITRYRLTQYLKLVLSDIGVEETLVKA